MSDLSVLNQTLITTQALHSLFTSVLGSAFGFYVYGTDLKTAICIFLPALLYNFLTPLLCLLAPLLKMMIIPFMMLLSCCIIRYSIGGHKKHMVDAMVSSMLEDAPSYAIMETSVSLISFAVSLIQRSGYIIGNTELLLPSENTTPNVKRNSIECLKTMAIIFAILFSGKLVKSITPDPELSRIGDSHSTLYLGIIDLVQISRSIVAGSYILGEGLFFENRNLSDVLTRLFVFESAYNAYYALRSENIPGPITNLITGTIFGYLFRNITTPSDIIAMSITAPSSGIVRSVYSYYTSTAKTQKNSLKNLKRMALMVMLYGLGVFIARNCADYLGTDSIINPFSISVTICTILVTKFIITLTFTLTKRKNATKTLPNDVGEDVVEDEEKKRIREERKLRKEKERLEKEQRKKSNAAKRSNGSQKQTTTGENTD